MSRRRRQIFRFVYSRRFWWWTGVVLLAAQFAYYLFYARTWLDEGNYAFKGWLAVSGTYPMYAEGGVSYLYMPLAYLVPGVVQVLFGPDYFAARLFSIVCAGLLLWLACRLTRALCDGRAALIFLWLMTANVVTLRYFSTGTPYAWVAVFLVSSVWILTSKTRSPYREMVSILLVTVCVMTRRNMIFSWIVIVCFCLWVQTRKRDILAVAASALAWPAIFLAPFWPEVKAPMVSFPFVGGWLQHVLDYHPPRIEYAGAMLEFGNAEYRIAQVRLLQFYFGVIGAAGVGLLTHAAAGLRSQGRFHVLVTALKRHRVEALTGFLFVGNAVLHVAGPRSFGPTNAIPYFSYFLPLGAVLGGVGLSRFLDRDRANDGRLAGTALLFMALALWLLPWSAVFGYSSFDALFFHKYSASYLLVLAVYAAGLLFGSLALVASARAWWRRPAGHATAPGGAWGAILSLAVCLAAALLLWGAYRRIDPRVGVIFGFSALVGALALLCMVCGRTRLTGIAMLAAFMLAPLHTGAWDYMLEAKPVFPDIYRGARRLAAETEPHERVFALCSMHMLFLADRTPYPPLIERAYSLVVSDTNTDTLLKRQRWNFALAERWLEQADAAVISRVCLHELSLFFKGYSPSGQDLRRLIETTLEKDFVKVARLGSIEHIDLYRRRRPEAQGGQDD